MNSISLASIPKEALERGVERYRHATDKVRFTRDIGSRLRRDKIDPDRWQQDVLRSTSKRVLLNCGRQVGKSTVVGALTLHKAVFEEETLSLIVAPTERQAKITFLKVARFYQGTGGNISAVNWMDVPADGGKAVVKKMSLELSNGSQVIALPGNADTIRGFSAHLVVLDEAAFMDDELYAALRPSLAATGGDLIAISTPNGKQGWFYKAWIGEGAWERHRVLSTECPRISDEFLAEERLALPDHKYCQEYLCEFVDTEDQVFPNELIEAARDTSVEVLF